MATTTTYHVSSVDDPYGEIHTVKRSAIRTARKLNREVESREPGDWETRTEAQQDRIESALYDVTATRNHRADPDFQQGHVDLYDGRIDWA